jgi:ATPases involved in chromosome partitioning
VNASAPPKAKSGTVKLVKNNAPQEELSPPKWEDPLISVREGGLKPISLLGTLKARLTLKHKNTVRSLTHKDRLVFEEYWREAEIERLISRLKYLAVTEALQPTVSFLNFKSGGKSTTVLYVGSVIAEYTRKQVIAVTASGNTDTATLSEMAGVQAQPVSVFASSLKAEDAYRELSRSMKSNRHGLHILGEFDSEDEIEPHYTVDQFRSVVRGITIATDVILFDHGNDNMDVGNDVIPYAAIDYSDVLVFTATASAPISEKTMRKTWRRYARDPRSAEDRERLASQEYQEGRLPGLVVPTARKVAQSLVVHNGVRPGDESSLLEETDEIEMFGSDNPSRRTMIPWLGKQLDVGFEPYIANKSVPPTDLDKISREGLRQYLTIAVAIFETSASVNDVKLEKGNPFKDPMGPYQDLN